MKYFSDEHAIVKKDGKYGLLYKTGELVIPCAYDFAIDTMMRLAVYSKGVSFFIEKKGCKFILFKDTSFIE